jgi:protein-S-isoprenylcysteine O-methyltransferase Ste14
MSFTGKWIDLVYTVATGDWKTRLLVAPLVGAFYLGLIAIFIVLSFALDRLIGLPQAICVHWSSVTGWTVAAIGLILTLISIAIFLKAKGTPVPFSPPPTLITSGPYRFVRNPMLTGIFIQLFGIGIALGSLSLMCVFTPLFIFINVWELKKVEEPELERRLGPAYTNYKNCTPMFFPFGLKQN